MKQNAKMDHRFFKFNIMVFILVFVSTPRETERRDENREFVSLKQRPRQNR